MEFAIEVGDHPVVDYPEERWATLGAAIRRQLLHYGWNQSDLIRQSGVSNMTVRPVMAGEPGNRQEKTLSKLSRALGWGGAGIVSILEGADPSAYIREHRDDAPDQIDLNSAAAELSPESRRAVLDFIAAERRKQQS